MSHHTWIKRAVNCKQKLKFANGNNKKILFKEMPRQTKNKCVKA